MCIRSIALAASTLVLSTSVNAALVERIGGLAYFDTELDITWLADSYAAGSSMDWATANSWAAGLNVSGVTGWRLPDTIDVGNDGSTYTNLYQGVDSGYNITAHSEMSHLFYVTLGNLAYYDTAGNAEQPGWGLTNTGPFNIPWNKRGNYWSATEYAADSTEAWTFILSTGLQNNIGKLNKVYAWAVHDGDVANLSAVPVPAAVWLFGSGLLGLVGVARRKKA